MSKANMAAPKRSAIDRVLDGIERVANKLPPPGILFCYLFIIVAVLGAIFSFTGITLANPATQEPVSAQNFFSTEGIQWLLGNLVKNFTGFAPARPGHHHDAGHRYVRRIRHDYVDAAQQPQKCSARHRALCHRLCGNNGQHRL